MARAFPARLKDAEPLPDRAPGEGRAILRRVLNRVGGATVRVDMLRAVEEFFAIPEGGFAEKAIARRAGNFQFRNAVEKPVFEGRQDDVILMDDFSGSAHGARSKRADLMDCNTYFKRKQKIPRGVRGIN